MLKLDARNKKVLILSDLHFPWALEGWYGFLKDLHEKRKYDIIISIGDEIDHAAISFHEKENGMPSASKELEMAQDEMALLHTLFPKVYVLTSNHGSLIHRKLKFGGIPYEVLKPLPELYGCPLYEWHDEIILKTNSGDVYLCHGKSSAYGKMVRDTGVSCIQGHFHSKAEITFHKTIGGLKFSMFVGCLADQQKIAFRYAKNNIAHFINAVGELNRQGKPNLIFFKPSAEKND